MTRLAAALLLAIPLPAAESLNLSSPELIAEGSALFAKSCAVGYCHGSEGRSARGPGLRERVWDPHELYRITADGLPGTSMPGWKDVIADSAVWAITAYVLSLSTEPPSGAAAIVEPGLSDGRPEQAEFSENAVRGKELFFDLTRERRCGVCHELNGMGTAVGPNLTLAARAKTARQLTRDILSPQAAIAFGFEQLQLVLHSGERIDGVLAEETESRIRIFDAASVPHSLRSVSKRDIRRQKSRKRSSMPRDLGQVYSASEIASIVTYLKELGH